MVPLSLALPVMIKGTQKTAVLLMRKGSSPKAETRRGLGTQPRARSGASRMRPIDGPEQELRAFLLTLAHTFLKSFQADLRAR
jgi:hypothetical protein